MPYLVPLDLVARFGAEEMAQLADKRIPRRLSAALLIAALHGDDLSSWDDDAQEIARRAQARLEQATRDGQSEVDSYLSSRYAVPLADPPAALKRFTGDIARYALYEDHAKEEVRLRYKDAIAFLKNLAAGDASLGAGESGETPGASGGTVEWITAGKVFGRAERGL
jgi:phage gp36-like protein